MDEKPKPKFSDIVGGLVSGVAQARSIADVEALRMAHRYRQIELLKGMPVPRLRFRRVSISIPMLISEIIPGKPCIQTTIEELVAKVADEAVRVVDWIAIEAAQDAKDKPSDETKYLSEIAKLVNKKKEAKEKEGGFNKDIFVASLTKRLGYRYQKLNIAGATPAPDTLIRDTAGEVARDLFSDALMYIVRKIIPKMHEKKKTEAISEDEIEKQIKNFLDYPIVQLAMEKVRNEAESAAVKKPTISPDFYVSVDTETIKNAGGGPNTVTRFNMVLLEEGLEWVTETRDGAETSKLMQE
jgi:hypothetical protein